MVWAFAPAAAHAAMPEAPALRWPDRPAPRAVAIPALRIPEDIKASTPLAPRKPRLIRTKQVVPAPASALPSEPARPRPAAAKAQALPPSRGSDIDVPVIVNDLQAGSVRVHVEAGDQSKAFDYRALMAILAPGLATDVVAELDAVAGGREFVPFQQTQGFKVPIRFDEDQLAIVVTVAPGLTRVQAVDLHPLHRSASVPVVTPAAASAYVNVRANAAYLEGHGGGVEPFRLDFDGAANIRGYVLEGRADYVSGNALQAWAMSVTQAPRWQRGDVRLVHDDVGHMLRYAAGDLSYPVSGFQSFQSMAGLSVARNFTLQPYNVFKPTGQSSILLTSASQVEVFVNGNRDRVLHLPAGHYSLSDFPVVDGVNDVHLLITDASGHVEAHTLSIFTSDNLLKSGVSAFAWNLGVPSTVTNGRIWYGHNLTFSGFDSYGLSDTLTVGGNVQGDADQQMAGATTVYQTAAGNVQLDMAGSRDRTYGDGTMARVQYSYADARRRNFDLALSYRDPGFQPLGVRGRATERYTAAVRYGQAFPGGIQASFGARLVNQRGPTPGAPGSSQWAYNANFSKAISRSLSINLTMGGGTDNPVSAFFSLSWVPGQPNGRRGQSSGNLSYDSASQTARADWNYNSTRHGHSLSTQLSAVSYGGTAGVEGDAEFAAYRYQAEAARVFNSDGTAEDQARFSTAVVFADGHVAVSRPVADSFALIYPNEDLRGHEIGINPSAYTEHDVTFAAVASKWGPAVLPDMEAYYDRPVTIDTRHIPAGFDVGASQLMLAPTYRSGVIVEVGTGADAYARGRLVISGRPVVLATGEVTGPKGYDRQIFTDRNGVFYAYGLTKGAYRLTVVGTQKPLDFTIVAARGKMVELGDLEVLPVVEQVTRQ